MNRMKKHNIFLIFILLIAGCSKTVSMFPTSGPIKQNKQSQVLIATVENITSNSGPFSVTYPDGDFCKGRWASIAPQMVAMGWGNLFSQYGNVAGTFTSVSNLPGVNRGEAMAICQSGNQLKVEFLTGSGTANGTGIAVDDKGNVFKLIF